VNIVVDIATISKLLVTILSLCYCY